MDSFEFMAASFPVEGFNDCSGIWAGTAPQGPQHPSTSSKGRKGSRGSGWVAFPAIVMEISSCFPGGHHLHNS